MRVFIVNPFDNLPLEGYRPMRFWLMAEAFAQAGHEVVYWTADFSHANKAPRRLLPNAPRPPFRVELLPEPSYRANVSLKRLYAHGRWARNWTRAVKDEPKADLVVVSSPPLAIGAAVRRYASRVGAKMIVDVMDDWPGTFERVVPRFLLAPLRRLVRRTYLAATAITVVSDRYADLVRSVGFSGPVRRFYHGIALGDPPAIPDKREGDLKLLYLGNLGRTYDLSTAIEAVAMTPGVTLDIAGDGDEADALKELAARLAPDSVRFHGYVDEARLNALLAVSDAGLVPMAPASCVGVPYKFADYARAGVAIVSSLGGESGMLLARTGAGVAYRTGDAKNLANVLSSLPPRLPEMRRAARHLAESEFDADRIYSDYVDFATEAKI